MSGVIFFFHHRYLVQGFSPTNKQVPITLLSIGHQVDTSNRTVELRFAFDNDESFFSDQMATITINQTAQVQGFWVPLSALIDGIRGQWNIYIVQPNEQNTYTIDTMTVNVLYANRQYAYIQGLPLENHAIITQGVHRFSPGQHIRIAEPESTEVPATSAGSHGK